MKAHIIFQSIYYFNNWLLTKVRFTFEIIDNDSKNCCQSEICVKIVSSNFQKKRIIVVLSSNISEYPIMLKLWALEPSFFDFGPQFGAINLRSSKKKNNNNFLSTFRNLFFKPTSAQYTPAFLRFLKEHNVYKTITLFP